METTLKEIKLGTVNGLIRDEFTLSTGHVQENYEVVLENSSGCILDLRTDVSFDSNTNTSKKDCLRSWVSNNNITHSATNELLGFLNEWLPNEGFYKDARTLLKTPRNINIENKCNGQFFHFGIKIYITESLKDGLLIFNQTVPELKSIPNLISLKIGIDGLPISKSSNLQFWPILFSIDQAVVKKVHVASLFYGSSKPSDLEDYLSAFVTEMIDLENDGIIYNNKSYTVRIRCICADAPARSFLKRIKNHNAYYGCERCYRKGKWEKRVIYPIKSQVFPLHTNDTFRNQIHSKHHEGTSPFSKLTLGMITHIPLDYMHLCCLGIMKKLLISWSEVRPYKLSNQQLKIISERLVTFRFNIPKEFARKSRSLKDLRHWKATEFRLFLLYVGPAALVSCLEPKRFRHFMLFHCAMYILVSNCSSSWISFAENLLNNFVMDFPKLYHKDFLSYNLHSVQHLPSDVRCQGPVDNFSCFEFENYMQKLKRMLRKNCNHLAQVVKRIYESNEVVNLNSNPNRRFNSISTGDCFLTKFDKVCVVSSVCDEKCNVFYYTHLDGVPDYPFDSTKMSIFKVKNLSNNCNEIEKNILVKKCVLLAFKSDEICIPLCNFT